MQKTKIYFLYALLGIGLTVEGSNLQNLFYGFMATFRSDWLPIFNHLAAIGLAAFFLGSIVYNGVFDNKKTSWILAILTMTVSLYVYREIAPFSLSNFDLTHKHGVVLLLSVVLPYFVAFYTHLVDKEFKATRTPAQPKVIKSEFEKMQDSIHNVSKIHTEITGFINQVKELATEKEPQRISEVVKELKKQVVTPTVTSNQAPSETIIKNDNEVDIMELMHGQLEKK